MRNTVRELRKRNGDMTQDELATKVGCARQTINQIETGKFDPSLRYAILIARTFGTHVEEVFLLDDQPVPAGR